VTFRGDPYRVLGVPPDASTAEVAPVGLIVLGALAWCGGAAVASSGRLIARPWRVRPWRAGS
jgi:hypothetical protein